MPQKGKKVYGISCNHFTPGNSFMQLLVIEHILIANKVTLCWQYQGIKISRNQKIQILRFMDP